MANYLNIEYWNDTDLGEILYQDGFHSVMFFDIEVEKPEYNTTIESDLNGENVEITKFRKWEKVYRFELWAQEDLVDAFNLMQIHDNILITLQSGDVIQVAKHSLRVETEWEEIGCLAKLTVTFPENYIVTGNCNENMDTGCYCDPADGSFEKLEQAAWLNVANQNDLQLIWTVEDIAGKKYTASMYQFQANVNDWVAIETTQNTCWEDETSGLHWFYDGQYWHITPGYFQVTNPSGVVIHIEGWIYPGAFATVQYSFNGGVWTDEGTYTLDDLITGIEFDGQIGDYDIRLEVWNHSCDYKVTETEEITLS